MGKLFWLTKFRVVSTNWRKISQIPTDNAVSQSGTEANTCSRGIKSGKIRASKLSDLQFRASLLQLAENLVIECKTGQ